MPPSTVHAPAKVWNLASVALQDAYTDFILSRQAMNCTPATLEFYKHTAGAFLLWIESQGVTGPEQVTARHIRQHLALLISKGRKDTTLHAHARAIRTLIRFWHAEGIGTPKREKPPRVYTWNCLYCGQPFQSHSHAARYCSNYHKKLAYEERARNNQ